MNSPVTVTQKQLSEFLLNVALVRPVFIWGPPGIGKSALVQQFAAQVGLPCVSLLGSQLAPEDIIGVPQIENGVIRFCPPKMIAREEPYCLFLDELNACSHEVQKAFYSLIHERRIGEYSLPAGSIVIGAGNRSQDSAIVKPTPQLSPSLRAFIIRGGETSICTLASFMISSVAGHTTARIPRTRIAARFSSNVG